MGILDEDVERVRSAVPLVDLVQETVALRRVGRRWVGLCPFHAERTPSFSVSEELGFYKCFGCGASGDAISFVRETQHLDFVGAVELLAGRAGITLTYTSSGERRERGRRALLVEVLGRAVAWYHERLLEGPDARPARDYLRSRGVGGQEARQFRLGWAPDDWDALARALGVPDDVLRDTGLGFVNRRGRQQDAFRARVLFPIFDERGDPVAFGGRALPGSDEPKYKNSPETPLYAKSRTLYGLGWAKADAVASGELVVCEGYTDVIGFHQAGIPRAVATCGTALTTEHVRTMKRYVPRIVLAFDADEAGQGAAARFYEWEREFDVSVAVARLPRGQDPADVARRDPAALRAAVADALPFLGFRVQRALDAARLDTPEGRARAAEVALAMVNEHPNVIVRREYAGQVAARCGLPVGDLVALAEQGARRVAVRPPAAPPSPLRENAEVVALWLLLHRWDDTAEWLVPSLFADDTHLALFELLAEAGSSLPPGAPTAELARAALAQVGPAERELLERLMVADYDADPATETTTLVRAAAHRELRRLTATRDVTVSPEIAKVKTWLDELDRDGPGSMALPQLLGWLAERTEGSA